MPYYICLGPRPVTFSDTPVDPWAALDGRLNAPAGTPQYPNLLDGYAVRPPWQVAGVDYAVGINPSSYPLKRPNVDPTPPNCSLDVPNRRMIVNSGTNTLIDGWDFSGSSGTSWELKIHGGVNPIITNCDFTGGNLYFEPDAGGGQSGTSSSGTVRYCILDEDVRDHGTPAFRVFTDGVHIFEYNWIRRGWTVNLQCTYANDKPVEYYFRYNITENARQGPPPGAHGDWIQMFGVDDVVNIETSFNLGLQTEFATQGFSYNAVTPTITNGKINNNTMIASTGNVNAMCIVLHNWCVNDFHITDNYVDRTDNPDFLTNGFAGPHSGHVLISGTVDMSDGTIFPPTDNSSPY